MKLVEFPNHYKTLGVSRNATPKEIRDAYLRLAQIRHPDRGGDAGAFAAASIAYHVLIDVKARAVYNGKLCEMLPKCPACDGKGAVRRSKGLTAVVNLKCSACDGAGCVM